MAFEEPKHVIDALSHVDPPITDSQRDAAMELIHQEMESYEPAGDYLDDVPDHMTTRTFQTDLLKQEYDRILPWISDGKQPYLEHIDQIIVDTPPPPRNDNSQSDEEVAQWQKCLNQLRIKLEYRQRQVMRLELLKTYGGQSWEASLAEMEEVLSSLERESLELTNQVQDIGESFQRDQEHAGRVLNVLRQEWSKLIDQNHLLSKEIERLISIRNRSDITLSRR